METILALLKRMKRDSPPPSQELLNQAEAARAANADITFVVENDYERLCLICGYMNTCTGVDTCTQCNAMIDDEHPENFTRVKESQVHNPHFH